MSAANKIEIDTRTTQQVALASNPENSAWVSANAGSGKTFVLTRRVVRLLLKGSDPSRLLCLTFTKAAAGEMSNRIFEALGEWATVKDDELRQLLTDVEGKQPTADQMVRARTLFARALETPGGLKIQTIHAFCEALLHQFPLEANVPGSFDVMDDAQQVQLMEQARREVVIAAQRDPGSEPGRAFSQLLGAASDAAIEKVLGEVVSQRDELSSWLRQGGGPEAAMQTARKRFQFLPDDTVERLEAQIVTASSIPSDQWHELKNAAASAGQKTATELANMIGALLNTQSDAQKLPLLQSILLTKAGASRSFEKYPGNPVEQAIPGARGMLAVEAGRLIEALQRIATFRLIEKTKPLLVFAQAMLDCYRLAKRRRGLLDFDDLVARTADLLSTSDARAWVLYKLDLGIDHILLDEAQDTSPRQWQVIAELVEEFFAGKGARDATRTVFAVGDEKQSIYSFQGAEPALFAQHRERFARKADSAGQALEDARLTLSFRSTPDVLAAVDKVFADPRNAHGLTFGSDYQLHTAVRKNDPGSVEVWPFEMARPHEEPESWSAPPDMIGVPHQAVRLADRIADDIVRQVREGRHEASGKRIGEGDIIVLVRARDLFVTALTRSLKDRGIAVAGADRLAITDHIAVLDLMALGQVMLTSEDDLSLAAVLRSPLFGMSEESLLQLARYRVDRKHEQSLFEALEELSGEAEFARTFEKLTEWRKRADAMPVYEFYAQLLGADRGRQQFYQRLGPEAEDVLDAFLDTALTHERAGLPGLQAFLEDLANQQPQIKRELDGTAGEVRVMTVHAAKGLEAEIVYLVDKGSAAFQSGHAPALFEWGEDGEEQGWLWVPSSAEHGDATSDLLEEEKRKAEEEYRRLLYVAMTRAKDKLVVCGYCGQANKGGEPPVKDPNWHRMIAGALEEEWVLLVNGGGTIRYVWKPKDSPKPQPGHHADEAMEDAAAPEPLPNYIRHHLPAERALPRPLNPSGAQALIEESLAEAQIAPSLLDGVAEEGFGAIARRRGTAVHLLLQVLPDIAEDERHDRALAWLAKALPEFSQDALLGLADSVNRVMNDPGLAAAFDPATSRAEVPVMGRIDLTSGPRPVSGTIDRMAVLDDQVVLIDFKTSAMVPDSVDEVPKDYVTQMALYRSLIARLYPDKTVEAWLIWTSAKPGFTHMKLPAPNMDSALAEITAL